MPLQNAQTIRFIAIDAARLLSVGLAARRTFAIRPICRAFAPFLTILGGAFFALVPISTTSKAAFAQTSPNRAASTGVLTPEEVSGASLQNFDAVRAMGNDYLASPDGGDVPVDEDDVWLPDLALAQKPAATSARGTRVIAFDNGKVTTETRGAVVPATAAEPANAPSKVVQTQNLAQTPQTASNAGTSQTPRLAQNGGFADYQTAPQTAQNAGFADYQVVPTTANVAPVASTPVVAVPNAGYDAQTGGFENYQVASQAAQTGGFSDYQVAPSAAAFPQTAQTVQTAPNVPSADFPQVAPNASIADFPQVAPNASIADFPQIAPVAETPQNAASNARAEYVAQNFNAFDAVSPASEPSLASAPVVPVASSEPVAPVSGAPVAESTSAQNLGTQSYAETTELEKSTKLEESTRAANETPFDAASLSKEEAEKLIVDDIRISGLEMTTQQFNKIVKTRIGARFNQQRLEEDKRALLQTKQFVDVAISTSRLNDRPDRIVVNFDLTSRRMMRYVKIVGNRKIAKIDILEELGIKPGETRMDPYEVENGRIRIIEFYKSKDYAEPHVEILRGDRPEDVGVVYLIDEGRKQKVLRTTFVGNTIASGARLRSLISVKPGILYLIGGDFTRQKLDEDVQTLLEYYRRLGFFDAKIDREYEEGEGYTGLGKDNAWVTVRFIIDEGPRYKVRNFLFAGNRVLSKEELAETLKVKSGDYYNQDEIEADRIALRYKYQDLGYVRADITPTQLFTDEPGVLDVRYDVSEDHRYRIRDVIVDYVGTEARTKHSVVWNMLDFSPGELLNGRKIRMSENTLRQSGYFNDKPSEGQLPEIAVVPDESRSFRVEKGGDESTSVVKEARRLDDGDSKSSKKPRKTYFNGKLQEADDGASADEPDSNGGDASTSRYGSVESPASSADFRRVAYQVPADAANAAVSPNNAINGAFANAASSSNAVVRGASPEPAVSPNYSPYRAYGPALVRGQTRQIPTGFSNATTSTAAGTTADYSGYSSYDSTKNGGGTSQYAGGADYAGYESINLDGTGVGGSGALATDGAIETAPGFSDGVYGSVGKEILDPISPDDDEIYDGDVLVKIQEGRTGMFQASVGVNSDYGLVGNVSFTERNFDLFRLPTSFCRLDGWKDAFRGGGQIFNVTASPGTTVQRYSVSWDVPYVLNTKNTFGVTGLYGDRSYDEWFETRYGGEVRLGRQWTPRFSTTVNAGAYNVKISDPAVDYCPDLNEVIGRHSMYTIGLSSAYDVRNHPYSPSAGHLIKGTIEQVMGDYSFPRASLDGRYYKTLHDRYDHSGRWVLGLSTHAGWTDTNTPIYERYYGGGSANLRGFEYREVTPRYLNTGFGVGGKFEFYNTAELLIPISGGDEFQFACFVDAGTVAENIKNWGTFRVSPGLGLRFNIPMMGPAPLALDFAFPVSKDKDDVTQVFSFSMSGSR